MEFGHPVSLILVDASFLAAVEALSGIIQARHPGSIIAVMYDDGPGQDRTVNDILGSKAVRGVLPMNLRLDIWLSVIRLMLRGGEYFPSSFFRKKSVPDTNDRERHAIGWRRGGKDYRQGRPDAELSD